jgi:hypothetical protein
MTRSAGNRFRTRKLSTKQSLAILRENQIDSVDDDAQRHIPQIETGVERQEEIVCWPLSPQLLFLAHVAMLHTAHREVQPHLYGLRVKTTNKPILHVSECGEFDWVILQLLLIRLRGSRHTHRLSFVVLTRLPGTPSSSCDISTSSCRSRVQGIKESLYSHTKHH